MSTFLHIVEQENGAKREADIPMQGSYGTKLFANSVFEVRIKDGNNALIAGLSEIDRRVQVDIKNDAGGVVGRAYTTKDSGVGIMPGANVEVKLPLDDSSPVVNIKVWRDSF